MITNNEAKLLRSKIKQIPSEDGFWRASTETTFYNIGVQLFEKGFSVDETIEILESLYFASANEFGS